MKHPDLEAWYNQSYTLLMKTAVSIPDPVFHAADSLARRLGISRSQLFKEALEAYISEHDGEMVREALDDVYSNESSDLDSALAQLQLASLPDEDW